MLILGENIYIIINNISIFRKLFCLKNALNMFVNIIVIKVINTIKLMLRF